MFKRIVLIICIVGVVVALVFPQPQSQAPAAAQTFDREAMMRNITMNIILPAHERFVTAASDLQAAALAFQADPTEENLLAWQDAWRNASLAWEGIEVYQFRATLLLHTAIERQPLNIERLERVIGENPAITADEIEGFGTNIRGMTAIEYLIFTDLATITAPARLNYAVAVSENVAVNAAELYSVWSPDDFNYAETFITGGDETVRETLGMLVNQMTVELELVLDTKLQYPLGDRTGTDPNPLDTQAPFSKFGREQVIANLQSLRDIYTGGDGLGLDDYLDHLASYDEGRPLSDVITEQFDVVLAALVGLDMPLETAVVENPDAVRAIVTDGRALLVFVRVDMVTYFAITITFNSNDGD